MSNLGPQFGLYHGTHREIKGEHILPAEQAGHPANFGLSEEGKAYATESENAAWDMASLAQFRDFEKVPGRTRVHAVEPHPSMEVGRYHRDHPEFEGRENLAEWTAPQFKVTGTHDVKPGHQGTFSQINWNEHRNLRLNLYGDEVNHPTDDHIEYGHPGGGMNQEHLKNLGAQWKTPEVADVHQESIPGLETYRITGNYR